MVEEDLGEATIVYEDPDEGTVEKTVQNEHVAYFQDHWMVKTGEDEQGRDTVRRIPTTKVHYVERTVEEFQDEMKTFRDQVQSFTDDLRSKLLGEHGSHGRGSGEVEDEEVYRIDVESGEEAKDDDEE
ncbi:hypothetical protein [Halorussus halophilus]|uniref:hypothetical protein n=1 Tax=Halorussus halophilus TaxID=2650975 RepID=UPI0013017971|nr:hypothetical protein [Halorussus halophilus]